MLDFFGLPQLVGLADTAAVYGMNSAMLLPSVTSELSTRSSCTQVGFSFFPDFISGSFLGIALRCALTEWQVPWDMARGDKCPSTATIRQCALSVATR